MSEQTKYSQQTDSVNQSEFKSGIEALDKHLARLPNGLQRGELTVFCGIPRGDGVFGRRSMLTLDIMRKAIAQGKPVVYIDLEMPFQNSTARYKSTSEEKGIR